MTAFEPETITLAVVSGVWGFALLALAAIELREALRGFVADLSEQAEWHA